MLALLVSLDEEKLLLLRAVPAFLLLRVTTFDLLFDYYEEDMS